MELVRARRRLASPAPSVTGSSGTRPSSPDTSMIASTEISDKMQYNIYYNIYSKCILVDLKINDFIKNNKLLTLESLIFRFISHPKTANVTPAPITNGENA